MSKKSKRSGGKYCGNHTTVSDVAAIVCDIADASPNVTSISVGFLKNGLRPAHGQRRVKIVDQGSCILLSVRGNISHQEIHVYADDKQAAMEAIARGARNAGLAIGFGKPV